MNEKIRKPREVESNEERAGRREREDQQRLADDAADDDRIDAMVTRNIELKGP